MACPGFGGHINFPLKRTQFMSIRLTWEWISDETGSGEAVAINTSNI
jgi:hypothetical protein